MPELWSQSIVVRAEFHQETGIVLAVYVSFLLNVPARKALVVLVTGPGYQISPTRESWSPTVLEK